MKSCQLAWQFTEAARPLLLSKVKPPQIIEPDEIIVLNKVASINPVDWKFIDNNPLDWQAGYIPGVDGAGIVIKAGSQVPSDMLGKRVCYHQSLTKYGSFSSYTVLKFSRIMTLPMSTRGNCLDNAVMERFFRSLKTERLNNISFINHESVVCEVVKYIAFYNYKRRHSALGYMTPHQQYIEMKNAA